MNYPHHDLVTADRLDFAKIYQYVFYYSVKCLPATSTYQPLYINTSLNFILQHFY